MFCVHFVYFWELQIYILRTYITILTLLLQDNS